MLRKPSRLGPHALPALAVTALVLALPATALPFVSLSKFGDRHDTFLMSSVDGFARAGLPYLAALVLASAVIAPIGLAGLLAAWWWVAQGTQKNIAEVPLRRSLDFIQHWTMPEVFALGVLIAFVKLDLLVHASARPGLWCYGGMVVAVLGAWHTFALQFRAEAGDRLRRDQP